MGDRKCSKSDADRYWFRQLFVYDMCVSLCIVHACGPDTLGPIATTLPKTVAWSLIAYYGGRVLPVSSKLASFPFTLLEI